MSIELAKNKAKKIVRKSIDETKKKIKIADNVKRLSVKFTTDKESSSDEDYALPKLLSKESMIVDDEKQSHELQQFDSKSLGSVDSFTSPMQQKSLITLPDFFAELGEVPNIEDISIYSSEDDVIIRRDTATSVISDMPKLDEGRFTDPMTGEVLISSSEDLETEEELEIVEEEVEEEEESDAEDADLLQAPEIEDDAELISKFPDDDDYMTFFEMDTEKHVVFEEKIDLEAIDRENQRIQLQLETQQLVYKLIDSAVDISEYEDPCEIMRQNLDKEKLMHELHAKLSDLEIEQSVRFFLNRKTVDYFRRRKSFRPIMDDNPDTITEDIIKYKEAMAQLDEMLAKEQQTQQKTSKRVHDLKQQVEQMEHNAQLSEQNFEELIKKSLLREGSDKIKMFVANILAKVSKLRDEISKVRLLLIQNQHTLAALMEQSESLENVGNGLRMKQFEHLQTETQALDKKIEERNADLNKSRVRFNADLHVMAHMKEKSDLIRNTILIQQETLRKLRINRANWRQYLFYIKLERAKMRSDIGELSFQGGLLDKPALMMDYDVTVANVENLRARIDDMKVKYRETQMKIEMILKNSKEN